MTVFKYTLTSVMQAPLRICYFWIMSFPLYRQALYDAVQADVE